MWECTILRKCFQSVPADPPKKKQDKDDEDNKKDPDGFQQQQNVVNVIFGGDPNFSKRAQKLLLREILSVEPAIQRPLKYSEVPITWKVPACTRPSHPRIQAHLSTHRRWKRAQPDLRKYISQDGPQLYESTHSEQGSILRHRPQEPLHQLARLLFWSHSVQNRTSG